MDLGTLDITNPFVISGCAVLIFLVIGIVVLVMAIARTWKIVQARGWQATQGRVVRTEVGQAWTTESASVYAYFPKVTYEYIVGVTRYQGDQLALAKPTGHTDRTVIERQLLAYPAGSSVQVFYNPRNPAEAVLERKSPYTNVLWGVSALIFGLVAVIALLWLFLASVMGPSLQASG